MKRGPMKGALFLFKILLISVILSAALYPFDLSVGLHILLAIGFYQVLVVIILMHGTLRDSSEKPRANERRVKGVG